MTSTREETLQGLCPVCGAETPVLKKPSGSLEVHCFDQECSGWGNQGILLFVREDITNETGMQKMWY